MRFRTAAAGLVAVVLVPLVVSSPVGGQDQTGWSVNDSPVLFGPSEYWYAGSSGRGYGSNNFVYTYAIGGDSTADNWAHWYMGDRVGRQELEAYVPRAQATATVTYEIVVGGRNASAVTSRRRRWSPNRRLNLIADPRIYGIPSGDFSRLRCAEVALQ